MAKIKAAGKYRIEGKQYIVQVGVRVGAWVGACAWVGAGVLRLAAAFPVSSPLRVRTLKSR